MRILLVSQLYPGPDAPDLGTFVRALELALRDRSQERRPPGRRVRAAGRGDADLRRRRAAAAAARRPAQGGARGPRPARRGAGPARGVARPLPTEPDRAARPVAARGDGVRPPR